jgi:isoquinoline 1-oxidoreductase beta subunit
MKSRKSFELSRRDVLKAGASLTLAIGAGSLITACGKSAAVSGAAAAPLAPGAYLRIDADDIVTVISPNTEMGQGAYTGLATLVAEELDAAWSQVRVEGAPADVKRFGNPAFGGALQGTGGSTSVAAFYEPMRRAGATARAMLVTAAAGQWNVPVGEITVADGVVAHAGKGRSARFGELIGAAAALPVPETVTLKAPADFRLIGQSRPRVDSRAKSTGTAIFTQDLKLPEMVVASAIYSPRFGGKVATFDAAAAKALPGVIDVVSFSTPVRDGVAVIARDYWTAHSARDKVKVEWDESNAFRQDSDAIMAQYRELARKPGIEARNEGDADAAIAGATRRIEASYEFPFLAHASMEPLNCVAQLSADGCEIWNGEQLHTPDQNAVAKYLGLAPEQVRINMLYAGGSFGRRGNPLSDYVLDTVAIAKAAGNGKPVKLVWSREDDMRGGFYRPMYFHTIRAGLDASGKVVGWQHRIVGQSIMAGSPLDMGAPVDPTSIEGAANLPYDIPNLHVDLHTTKIGVPIQWWRSVGSTHTAYSTECFVDEIARATRQDPVELRRSLLQKHPRHLAALNLAAEKAGWGTPLPAGRARGVAVHESFGTVVAQVVEVTKQGAGYAVERVVCAVDCGLAVNPNIVAMQMESSIGFGLAAAFTGAITLKDGVVQQSNFHDYTVLRISQMPTVEVHIVPSDAKPTGVGEPGTPPIGPAVANAIVALGGKPVRSLPFAKAGLAFA